MNFQPLFGKQEFLHGADYNPEQWLDYPEVLEQDIAMMKQANCNIMSVGIFSWAMLEPQEGVFNFAWLDDVINNLYKNGIHVFLATPSGARPAWLSHKYPEVLRTSQDRVHQLHGGRHNHCLSSPIYREKVKIINSELAKRYANHPAVLGWHISNEYSGSCHCPLCQENFRKYLKNKYKTLDNLNKAYWSVFWSHTYQDWDQIESPSTIGENAVHALNLDWKRFATYMAMDFCKSEIDAVKPYNDKLKFTTNFMEFFYDYDYFEFAKVIDFVSWDSYPRWHFDKDELPTASYTAMNHDLMRSYKNGQPFVLMESTPSCTNWRDLSKLKKPMMHRLSSLQAVAHGADSIQYFQWRKSRGSSEKFHGAVVDHVGHINTRVGHDVVDLGKTLSKLGEIVGSSTKAEVAIVFDTQNRWAIDDSQGPRNAGIDYLQIVHEQYKAFWNRGISVDIIDESCDLNKYKLVVAPATYMIRGDFAKNVESFVQNGGTYVSTYWSGIVNETDLCFLGGFPGPLKNVLGIWDEETECLADFEEVDIKFDINNILNIKGSFKGRMLCALIHANEANILAHYESDFFANRPCVTCNNFGKGQAYYIATRMDDAFNEVFYSKLTEQLGIKGAIDTTLPKGVTCIARYNNDNKYVFVMNFNKTEQNLQLDSNYINLETQETLSDIVHLEPYASLVLKKA